MFEKRPSGAANGSRTLAAAAQNSTKTASLMASLAVLYPIRFNHGIDLKSLKEKKPSYHPEDRKSVKKVRS